MPSFARPFNWDRRIGVSTASTPVSSSNVARYDEALALWEEALKITPDNVIVLRNLGGAYFSVGRYDQAASILQRALEVRPVAAIYTNLGTLRFYQGRYADAVAAFEKSVELGAGNHLYWGNLGDGYRWAPGRRNEAPAAFRRAIALIEERIATAGRQRQPRKPARRLSGEGRQS